MQSEHAGVVMPVTPRQSEPLLQGKKVTPARHRGIRRNTGDKRTDR
jgi:hypothetical protein